MELAWECQNVYRESLDTREPTWVNRWIKIEKETVNVLKPQYVDDSEPRVRSKRLYLPLADSFTKPCIGTAENNLLINDLIGHTSHKPGTMAIMRTRHINEDTSTKQVRNFLISKQVEGPPATRKRKRIECSLNGQPARKSPQSSYNSRHKFEIFENAIPYIRSKHFRFGSNGDAAQEINSIGDGHAVEKQDIQLAMERRPDRRDTGKGKRIKSSVDREISENVDTSEH